MPSNDGRRRDNPLFNHRKLKLGTFSTNLEHGCSMTDIEGVLRISWDATLRLAHLANEMEFEAIVPVGRWKGFGGKVDFNGAGFECFTWAAGVGASVDYSAIFSTSHITTIHPLMAAKQATTIDHITGGRFILNLVTGWNPPEMEMFGGTMAEHDVRYEIAEEWLQVVKRLWTAEEPFDHAGKYYQIKQGIVRPRPLQRPHPPVMCAGGSPTGHRFAARFCDVAFININPEDLDDTRRRVEALRSLAKDEFGRDIQIWVNCYVVVRDSEQEAKEFLRYYVDERGDWEGATNLVATLGINSGMLTPTTLETIKRHIIGGWGGHPLVGTASQVVDQLAQLSNFLGVDGVILSWADYEAGMVRFRDEVMPLLEQAGLR